jgi:hypothetical protein
MEYYSLMEPDNLSNLYNRYLASQAWVLWVADVVVVTILLAPWVTFLLHTCLLAGECFLLVAKTVLAQEPELEMRFRFHSNWLRFHLMLSHPIRWWGLWWYLPWLFYRSPGPFLRSTWSWMRSNLPSRHLQDPVYCSLLAVGSWLAIWLLVAGAQLSTLSLLGVTRRS